MPHEFPPQLYSLENLRLAWKWVRSNPDRTYKGYCSPQYQRFAFNDEEFLEDLRQRLKERLYKPTRATKLFFPKASGILRPYSLLTTEDQIVYQAAGNLIAKALERHTRLHTYSLTFGHVYAGASSTWFYKKWTEGYRAYNKAARRAFKSGNIFAASFDLTACYDSLDHHVLKHFLHKLKLSDSFCEALAQCLTMWTATDQGIYQHHGIPQGPLTSGIISEVVLSHFDDAHMKLGAATYIRYVDDIRLFSKTEQNLRNALVKLDRLSKDVGLFPQVSKIHIHEVKDIEQELKSVSSPIDIQTRVKSAATQPKIMQQLFALSPRDKVVNDTKFKFYLSQALPNSKLAHKALRISKKRPEYVEPCMRYIRKYEVLPSSIEKILYLRIRNGELYDNNLCELIRTLDGRCSEGIEQRLIKLLKQDWSPKKMEAERMAAVGSYLIKFGALSPKSMTHAVLTTREWWVGCALMASPNLEKYSRNDVGKLLNMGIGVGHPEVACTSAFQLLVHDLEVTRHGTEINRQALILLRRFSMVRRKVPKVDGVNQAISEFTGQESGVRWARIFGENFKNAQRQALITFPNSKVNASALANTCDVFNDLLASALYDKHPECGTHRFNNIRNAALNAKFRKLYPATCRLFVEVHEFRYQSPYSHPIVDKTKEFSKAIPWSAIAKMRRLYKNSCHELKVRWG